MHQDVTAKINNVTLTGGAVDEGGGNILNHGSLTLFNATVSNGFTTVDGGGILSTSGGVLSLRRTTVSGNVAIFGGGGIAAAGRVELSNSTVSGNGATTEGTGLGGGIRAVGPLLVSVVDSTIADNFAATGGSAVSVLDLGGRGVEVRNSILAGQPGGVAACEGTGMHSLGWNLATDASCQLTRPTDLPATDPALGALTNNGGPTDTHLPAATSPAVNTGTADRCPATDQRGLLRPIGAACDRGSVEHHQPPDVSPSLIASSKDGGVWTIEPTGHGLRRVTDGSCPAFSPDGQWLAFCRAGGLGVVRTDGTEARMLDGTAGASEPAWSPDGSTLTFTRRDTNDPTQDGIWVMDSDGSDERLLVPGGLGPDWQVAG